MIEYTCTCRYFHAPRHLKFVCVVGAYIFACVCPSVRTSRKFCFMCIFETLCTTDLKLKGCIVQGVYLCSWVFSSIRFQHLTELRALILWNYAILACVAHIAETISTTDLKLHVYMVQDVNLCILVVSSIGF